MAKEIRCPNCGGGHELVNPGITMLVCSYCQTVVYWNEDAILNAGKRSILPEADTRLSLFASGSLRGVDFQVIGHVRYRHASGSWDEWYLQLDDGSFCWLSEDARKLTEERTITLDGAPPRADQLSVGQPLTIAGQAFSIREVGTATCIGAEGQLPFTVLPDEQYPYADAASDDGCHAATLEFDERAVPSCFSGVPVTHDQLTITDERPIAATKHGKQIACTNCRASLETPDGRDVETLVCSYCGVQLDLTQAEATVIGQNPTNIKAGFCFEIGQSADLHGHRYEVAGRMLYTDGEGYRSREYLLHNRDRGYLWLAEEAGHFVLNRPTQQAPSRNLFAQGGAFPLGPKARVTVGKTSFRFYEGGRSRLLYVDGALPWIAKCDDTFGYADLVAPPQMFGAETDFNEVEYFHGRYLPHAEVRAAFGDGAKLPRPRGIHPAQPFSRSRTTRAIMIVGAVFALINLLLLAYSFSHRGRITYDQTFSSADYLNESLSQPFSLGKASTVALTIAAPLANSWLALQVGLVNAQDEVVMELEDDISYYSGYEGGEYWSEGNRRKTVYAKAPPAGRYRLVLKGEAGSGHAGPARGEKLRVTIREGSILSRYFVLMLIAAALVPIFETVRQFLFEKRRWADVVGDD